MPNFVLPKKREHIPPRAAPAHGGDHNFKQ